MGSGLAIILFLVSSAIYFRLHARKSYATEKCCIARPDPTLPLKLPKVQRYDGGQHWGRGFNISLTADPICTSSSGFTA